MAGRLWAAHGRLTGPPLTSTSTTGLCAKKKLTRVWRWRKTNGAACAAQGPATLPAGLLQSLQELLLHARQAHIGSIVALGLAVACGAGDAVLQAHDGHHHIRLLGQRQRLGKACRGVGLKVAAARILGRASALLRAGLDAFSASGARQRRS